MKDRKGEDNTVNEKRCFSTGRSSAQTVTDSVDVVWTVAEKTGVAADELPPLYESLDPDVLDALLNQQKNVGNARISFMYAGVAVTVCQNGSVEVSLSATHE